MSLLAGKRVLVTGVLTERSIAWAIAREAQLAGADVVLTGHGRFRRMTARAAESLPTRVDVLELDATRDEDFERLAADLHRRWGGVDAAVHAIAWLPYRAGERSFLAARREDAHATFDVTAYSYKQLVAALAPLMPKGGSFVGLTLDARVAWPTYDWLGVAKAALESINRYLACELGPRGIRSNVLASGPIRSTASETFGVFPLLCASWRAQAPLGWDADDATPVARAACFLLSDWALAVSGGILYADGGYHAAAQPHRLHSDAVVEAGRLLASRDERWRPPASP